MKSDLRPLNSGFSLVEMLIAMAILTAAMIAVLGSLNGMFKQQRSLAYKLSIINLQNRLNQTLADGLVCDCQFRAPGLTPTVIFDAAGTGSLNLGKIRTSCNAASANLAEVGIPLEAGSPWMVKDVTVSDLKAMGWDDLYTGEFRIDLHAEGLASVHPARSRRVFRIKGGLLDSCSSALSENINYKSGGNVTGLASSASIVGSYQFCDAGYVATGGGWIVTNNFSTCAAQEHSVQLSQRITQGDLSGWNVAMACETYQALVVCQRKK